MNNNFGTADLYLASTLHSLGFKIDGVKTEGKKLLFLFIDRNDREEIIRQFYNGDLQVNALKFVDSIRNLKSLTFNL